jgi:sugar lactone lactonase YvrE
VSAVRIFLPILALVVAAAVVFGQVNYEPYEVRTAVPLINGDPIGSHAALIPGDIAVSPSGDLLILENFLSCIRKISANGAVTTVAGIRGAPGMVDGKGDQARFSSPNSLAVDAAGVIYVLDGFNSAVRKVAADGTVTTLAGGGDGTGGPSNTGSVDGFGRDARFNFPRGIAVSSTGTVYVGDSGNATIRAITPQGLVTTLSGAVGDRRSIDGPVATARFVAPGRMTADNKGNVYVLDSYAVRKITPDGNVITVAGKAGEPAFADGPASEARFSSFAGIVAAADGTLFVLDYGLLRMISPAGLVTSVAGGYPAQFFLDGVAFDGKGNQSRFRNLQGISIDKSGTLFVVDDKVRRITPDFTVTTLPAATLFTTDYFKPDDTGEIPPIGGPKDVAIDSHGNIYFADFGRACIRKLTPDGIITTLQALDLRRDGRTVPVAISPTTLAVHPDGDIYFAETSVIGRMTPDRVVRVYAGDRLFVGTSDGVGPEARFNTPRRMAFDRQNNLFVADTANATIRKIAPGAVVTTVAGSPGNPGTTDGSGAQARFAWPQGLTTDSAGNVYVADAFYIANSQTIRKITPDGVVSTLAGLAGLDGTADGVGSAARFHYPTAVAADARGNVYVADAMNRRLRKVTAAGVVTTLAGSDTAPFGGIDGIGAGVTFDTIMPGIALDGAGNLFVLDSDRLRVASTLKARSLNVSTRLQVLDGENVLIGGFIIAGSSTKKVVIRALGPSLSANSIAGALSDPILELYDSTGSLIASNDSWKIDSRTLGSQQALIEATTIPPRDEREAAIVATLAPQQPYTALVRGSHGEKGIAVIEVYDLTSSTTATLANISTRGFVEPGEKVMIGGFILGGNAGKGEVLVRALGPSLANSGIANPLPNPTLTLFDGNGQVIAYNDNWMSGNANAIQSTGLQPPNELESAISMMLPAGPYTAVVGGYEQSGVALVEVYNLP